MLKCNPLSRNFFRNNSLNLFMAVLGTSVLSLAILSVPQLFQILIDYLSGSREYSLRGIILLTAGIFLMEFFSAVATYFFRTKFSTRAVLQYRNFACAYLLKKKVADFYASNSSVYLSALSNDLMKIKEQFLDQIPIITQILFCGIGAMIVMLRYNVFLACMSCALSLIPFFAALYSGKNMGELEDRLSTKNAEYLAFLKDFSIGFTIIKSYKVEAIFSKLHAAVNEKTEETMLRRERCVEKVNYFAAISGYVTRLSILFLSAYIAFTRHSISIGTVIAFSQLIHYLIDPLSSLPSMLTEAKAAYRLTDKFWDTIKREEVPQNTPENNRVKEEQIAEMQTAIEDQKIVEEQEIRAQKQSLDEPIPSLRGELLFNQICFSYSEGKEVLKELNLQVKEGEKVVLLGTSGSGKSSILKILMGMERAQSGTIRIGGQDTVDLGEDRIFKEISYIQQEVFIFDGTIRENICLFQTYREEELQSVIERAGLRNLVKEKGLSYRCGENGAALSGGERQRISIARSLLRKTPILLADEITASLDKENSYLILDTLLNIENTTEILVLHDLDSRILSRVDRISVLKNGKVEEEGNFTELLEKKGYFYALYHVEAE
ncbi:MAG: ABC transporter ATP-binding protein [Lachnospiraceae bacterium]|nr:ABC transporter ATP-binding protein [Lachnospiraceae bacterium]